MNARFPPFLSPPSPEDLKEYILPDAWQLPEDPCSASDIDNQNYAPNPTFAGHESRGGWPFPLIYEDEIDYDEDVHVTPQATIPLATGNTTKFSVQEPVKPTFPPIHIPNLSNATFLLSSSRSSTTDSLAYASPAGFVRSPSFTSSNSLHPALRFAEHYSGSWTPSVAASTPSLISDTLSLRYESDANDESLAATASESEIYTPSSLSVLTLKYPPLPARNKSIATGEQQDLLDAAVQVQPIPPNNVPVPLGHSVAYSNPTNQQFDPNQFLTGSGTFPRHPRWMQNPDGGFGGNGGGGVVQSSSPPGQAEDNVGVGVSVKGRIGQQNVRESSVLTLSQGQRQPYAPATTQKPWEQQLHTQHVHMERLQDDRRTQQQVEIDPRPFRRPGPVLIQNYRPGHAYPHATSTQPHLQSGSPPVSIYRPLSEMESPEARLERFGACPDPTRKRNAISVGGDPTLLHLRLGDPRPSTSSPLASLPHTSTVLHQQLHQEQERPSKTSTSRTNHRDGGIARQVSSSASSTRDERFDMSHGSSIDHKMLGFRSETRFATPPLPDHTCLGPSPLPAKHVHTTPLRNGGTYVPSGLNRPGAETIKKIRPTGPSIGQLPDLANDEHVQQYPQPLQVPVGIMLGPLPENGSANNGMGGAPGARHSFSTSPAPQANMRGADESRHASSQIPVRHDLRSLPLTEETDRDSDIAHAARQPTPSLTSFPPQRYQAQSTVRRHQPAQQELTLRSGIYRIKNERTKTLAALTSNGDRSQLNMMVPRLGNNDVAKATWEVERLIKDRGRYEYQIMSVEFGTFAACDLWPKSGDDVLAKRKAAVWIIRYIPDALGLFMVSPKGSPDLYLHAPDDENGTPITLDSAIGNSRNHWRFVPPSEEDTSSEGTPMYGLPLAQ